MKQSKKGPNPYGRLGELAGYYEPAEEWRASAEAALDACYDDLDVMIMTIREAAIGVWRGQPEAEEALAEREQCYAAYWLIRKMDGLPLPDIEDQGAFWHSALAASRSHQPALALAAAGFDPVHAVIHDGTTILQAFVKNAQADDLREFLSYIPPQHQAEQINRKNAGDANAMHLALLEGGLGCIEVLRQAGGDHLALTTITHRQTGDRFRGNMAHLAVVAGRPDKMAELMTVDRLLFTRHDPLIELLPYELALEMHSRGIELKRETKMAANLAAYAVDHPMPFGDVAWVIRRLAPAVAPQPVLMKNQLN